MMALSSADRSSSLNMPGLVVEGLAPFEEASSVMGPKDEGKLGSSCLYIRQL